MANHQGDANNREANRGGGATRTRKAEWARMNAENQAAGTNRDPKSGK